MKKTILNLFIFLWMVFPYSSHSSSDPLLQLEDNLQTYLNRYQKYIRSQSIENQELARTSIYSITQIIFNQIQDEKTYSLAFQKIDQKSTTAPEAISDLALSLQMTWQKKYLRQYRETINENNQSTQTGLILGISLAGGISKTTPKKVRQYFTIIRKFLKKQSKLIATTTIAGTIISTTSAHGDVGFSSPPPPPSELLTLGVEIQPIPHFEILNKDLFLEIITGIEGGLSVGLVAATPTLQLKALATVLLAMYNSYSSHYGKTAAENKIAEWISHSPETLSLLEKYLENTVLSSWIEKLENESDTLLASYDAKKIIETVFRIIAIQMLKQNYNYSQLNYTDSIHENILASEFRKKDFRSDPKSLLLQLNAYLRSFQHRNYGNLLTDHFAEAIVMPQIVSLQP